MRNNLRTMFFAACVVIFFCVLNGAAQVRVGGYKPVETDDQGVIDAAEFAANTQSDRSNATIDIESIETAQKQIVQGANYKICMQVAVGAEGEEPVVQFVQTIVYRNLQQEFQLKSWLKVKSCA